MIDGVTDARATDLAPNSGEANDGDMVTAGDTGLGVIPTSLIACPSLVTASYLDEDDSVDADLIPSNPRLNLELPV